MYKLFLCLRYLLYRRIAIVPILAVMLCVAMNLIVMSVMGGFLDELRFSVRGLFGDIIISENSLAGFGYYDAYKDIHGRTRPGLLQYLNAISAQPATQPDGADVKLDGLERVVLQATPMIETYAPLRLPTPGRRGFTSVVRVLGIIPDQYSRVTTLQDGLYWQKPGPGGPVRIHDPERRDMDNWRRRAARIRENSHWRGSPDFFRVPATAEAGPLTPLSEVAAGKGEPVGIIVGARVFWSPDKQGLYPRQELVPGVEPEGPGSEPRARPEPIQLTFLPIYASGLVDEQPKMRQFHLVDTSLSKIPQVDQAIAYVPFDRLQQYLQMGVSDKPTEEGWLAPARATHVLVKLAPGVELARGRQVVQAAVDRWLEQRKREFAQLPGDLAATDDYYEPFGVRVMVWEEANREYFSAISVQRFVVVFMVGIVSLTAVALIWVIFIMIVVEKTKDIGIIKSVGGSASGVAIIFLAWAAMIGLIGSVLGGMLGYLFIANINGIEGWLSNVLNTKLWDPQVYMFEKIPARFLWGEMGLVALTAVLSAMIGAFLPAVRAGRMNPVRALQYE